ncbi:DUF4268 domain-containing protein [Halorhabdus utahensis]|uniref:DUF4268 domain-containing protein n=1 Tax=Halorhabdus utahensis TaxID=146826 RepID=UPI00247AFEE4|nr:DUF4268 domain-containing protein [Halorhabdus utahensis]
MSASEKERNGEIFETLKQDREEIESNLGTELVWQRLPEKQACRIKWPKPIDGRITELTGEQQTELIEWRVDAMDTFQDVLEPRVTELS